MGKKRKFFRFPSSKSIDSRKLILAVTPAVLWSSNIKTCDMRNLFVLFLILVVVSSCRFGWGERVNGNGRFTTEEREVSDFNSIDVSGSVVVHVRQDKTAAVKLETDENLQEYIEVFTSGDKLVIRTKEGFNLKSSKEMVAYVTAPSFTSFEISGACDIIGEGTITSTDELDISVSGAGNIELTVDLPRINTHVSGDGSIKLQGHASEFDASLSGAGDIKCFELETDKTALDLTGAASAEVNASKELDVKVSGAADVRYKGNASVTKNISGAGSVKKVG